MLATAAQAMEVEVVVALQGVSVFLAKKGYLEHVMAAGLPVIAAARLNQEILSANATLVY
jgi:predicted peroxiredoxin